MTKASGHKLCPTTVYLSDAMLDALEKRKRELSEEHPGLRVTMNDVMRNAIQRGLDCEDE